MKLGVLGAGRMGRAIVRGIADRSDCELAGVWVRASRLPCDDPDSAPLAPETLTSDLRAISDAADVLLDFTLPGTTDEIAAAALSSQTPLLCGVSGLPASALDSLARSANTQPILYDRNMSVGIAVMERLVHQAAVALGGSFEVEVHETHHIHKLDAPSGTALKLGESLARARGQEFAAVARYDDSQAAKAGDIRFMVTREGEVPGDHAVRFAGPNETLTLEHSVSDRQVFADGAIEAALWLLHQPP